MSRTNEMTGFQIVVSDSASDVYTHSIPHENFAPAKIYATYEVAKEALETAAASLPQFKQVAYGQAFPYENLSFGKLLYEKGYAPYGWFLVDDETYEDPLLVCIGLLRIKIVLPAT